MSNLDLTRFIIAISLGLVLITFSVVKNANKKFLISTRFIARSGVFAAISIILYIVPVLNINIPIFPEFLKFHFDEIPAFIAGFAYGPWSALLIILVKTVVKLPFSQSLGVGELIDLICTSAFVLPAAFMYQKKKKFKNVLKYFLISMGIQLLVSCTITTFVMLPFYEFVMGFTPQGVLAACQAVNPNITSLTWPYILYVALPFNVIKDVIVILITMLLYKRLHKTIDKIGAQKN